MTPDYGLYPNVPGCTCDRDDDSNEDMPRTFCPYHEERLRHLRWDTLACLVIDYEAALRVLGPPAPDEPIGWNYLSDDDMCPNCVTPWKCNGPHDANDTRKLRANA